MNLFPSCYAFLKFPKTRKKINRTSSDLLDKKNYNRHRKVGGDKRGVKSYLPIKPTSVLNFNFG